MLRALACVFATLLLLTPARSQTANPPYLEQAFLGINTLQGWYQPSTGLYATTGWWNAANATTVLANYSRLDHSTAFYPTFANTLTQAQTTFPHFLNDYYDDEGWWALAWIDVYDLTGNAQYLTAAQTIFTDMTGGWDNTCGGGIWWSKARGYKNAIANELFLSVAASLAARTTNTTQRAAYLRWAQEEWIWFHGSGMINSANTINDGLDSNCKNNNQTVWSYNQGVILGGLVQLNKVSADATLLPQAQTIANAAIAALSDSKGILHDSCEPNCGADGDQFKGVFLRNLVALEAAAPTSRYPTFATTNANSIFSNDRSASNQFGVVWSGPFDNAPNGASQGSALDAILAAAAMTSQTSGGAPLPSFTLTATPSTLPLKQSASAQTRIALSSQSGFVGTVTLAANLVGAPAGVTASLGTTTLSGSGTTTLTVHTTTATPGGTYTVAVTGTGSGGLFQAAYITLALPDFALTPGQSTLYLDQSGKVEDTVAVSALNGFDEYVNLDVAGLPDGVSSHLRPRSTATSSILTLSATPLAYTGSGAPFTLTGNSGATTHTASALSVAVSAALSDCGFGIPVNLAPSFNLTALHTDGTTYTDGGLDGLGYSFSANLLGTARVLNGIRYHLGPHDAPDAVYANGQTLALPTGRYNTLTLLGTGINGRQGGQALTVTYTDGTTAQLSRSFSDWYTPALNPDETEAVAMPYRNQANGTPQTVQFNLYGYTLPLDPTKTVKSLTLPSNRSVVLFAATLSLQAFGQPVDLTRAYNLTGITADGTAYSNGGVDGDGYSYSGNVLGVTTTTGTALTVGTSNFHLAAANTPDVVYANGQTIDIPAGSSNSLQLLGAAVGGNQLDQPLVLHFANGTSETRTQSFSDWFGIGNFPNESLAIRTPYRNQGNGTTDNEAFNLYLYTLSFTSPRRVTSITLPRNRNLILFGMTAVPPSALELAPALCGVTLP